MAETIYSERGIFVYEDNTILLTSCPKCNEPNWCASGIVRGLCVKCGYNAHEDKELMERMFNQTLYDNRNVLNRLKD